MGADCKSVAKATQVRILDPPRYSYGASMARAVCVFNQTIVTRIRCPGSCDARHRAQLPEQAHAVQRLNESACLVVVQRSLHYVDARAFAGYRSQSSEEC